MLIRQFHPEFSIKVVFSYLSILVAMKPIAMVTWRAADTVATQGFDECREFCSAYRGERQVGGEGCY